MFFQLVFELQRVLLQKCTLCRIFYFFIFFLLLHSPTVSLQLPCRSGVNFFHSSINEVAESLVEFKSAFDEFFLFRLQFEILFRNFLSYHREVQF